MRNYAIFIAALLMIFQSKAQPFLKPAPPQEKAVILLNGTIHVGNGVVIEHGALGFADGKITMIADARLIRVNPEEALVIDVTGKHIYPGLISLNSNLGLVEISALRASRDMRETGKYNPELRALVAYNTDSEVIPTVRSNGILLVETAPAGGRISGISSLMKSDGWNWEDAVYARDIGLHLYWPSRYEMIRWGPEAGRMKENKNWRGEVDEMHTLFLDAGAYCSTDSHPEKNIKLEALCPVLSGERKVFIHVNRAPDILRAIDFAREFGLAAVLTGAADSWMLTDEIKASGYPVVLESIHRLPAMADRDIDQPFRTPAILAEAGILFCISRGGPSSFWDQRNLPFLAGTAVTYGLDREVALQAVSSHAARIAGVDDRTGTLEEGKDANIIVCDGDLFEMKESVVSRAFIEGRMIDLNDKQKMLYKKYSEKYGLNAGEEDTLR